MEERRQTPRARKRMLCQIRVGPRRHSGMVLDVSLSGVFVQTTVGLPPGAEIGLTIQLPRNKSFELRGRVARVVVAPQGLRPTTGGGVGVMLAEAPADYLKWVAELVGTGPDTMRVSGATPVAAAPNAPALRSFHVRLKQIRGNRTRSVMVRCGSEAEASELARAEFDESWKVLDVEVD